MSCLSTILLVSSLAGDPIDPTELNAIRQSLESYLSRIRSIHLKYVETWEEKAEASKLSKPMLEAELKLQMQLPDSPERQRANDSLADRMKTGKFPKIQHEYDVIDSFPFYRMLLRERTLSEGGSWDEKTREMILKKDEMVTINWSDREAFFSSSTDRTKIPNSPLCALGLRIPYTINVRAHELLQFPEITSNEGLDLIDGLKAIVLRIGPNIPAPVRPPRCGAEGWVIMRLAVDHHHIPLRIEVWKEMNQKSPLAILEKVGTDGFKKHYSCHLYSVSDLRNANDNARRESVQFPFSSTFDDGGGLWKWQIQEVQINPTVEQTSLKPEIPDGFYVYQDGHPRISGGTIALNKGVEETVDEARKALTAGIPGSSKSNPNRNWRLVVTLCFLCALVLFSLFRWRRSHASR